MSIGTFQLHVKEDSRIENRFKNSPVTLKITAVATAPEKTVIKDDFEADFRIFRVTTFDKFDNLTGDDAVITYHFDDAATDTVTVTDKLFKIERYRPFRSSETLHLFLNGVKIESINIIYDGMDPAIVVVAVSAFVAIVSFAVRRARVEQNKRHKIYIEKEQDKEAFAAEKEDLELKHDDVKRLMSQDKKAFAVKEVSERSERLFYLTFASDFVSEASAFSASLWLFN